MGPEINIDSILALERQIGEGVGDVIHLKRARNSLLNISTRIPPEILGHIFWQGVAPEGDFGGLRKGSYNFLLVCHRWFEIASSTPELWSFWGNTLGQWSQRYRRSGITPIDITLSTYDDARERSGICFDGPLRDALRDRAARDSIRSVHLRGWDTKLLHPVISSLILDGEDIRDSSIESLVLGNSLLDISDFLAHYRFPKLRTLRLSISPGISPWDHLKLQPTSLITLSLGSTEPAGKNRPNTSQLLSILASYPNLQDLSLHGAMIPHDVEDGFTHRVPLRHLKKLSLRGDCCQIFQLLGRLECPDTLDCVDLDLEECVGEEIPELLKSYLQDRIRRDDRFQDRLGIYISFIFNLVVFGVGVVGEFNTTTMVPGYGCPSVSFRAIFRDRFPQGAEEKLCVDLIALTPRERVVRFTGGPTMRAVGDLLVAMPNIEDLSLKEPVVSDMFLRPDPLSHAKLLPSLRRLCLDCPTLQNDGDWSSLIAYLAHQTSDGQAISLRLHARNVTVPPEVVKEMEGLVDEFSFMMMGSDTPFGQGGSSGFWSRL